MRAERALTLTGRSGSHFTRVVRMIADELGVAVELDVLHDLTSLDPGLYGGNPALKIPTLQVDGGQLFGTENICRRIAELAGRADDPRVVLSHQHKSDLERSAQELVWHAMAAQVQLLVGLRFAKLPSDNVFFAKAQAGLLRTLAWLDARLEEVLAALPAPRDLSVFEVTLFCLVEHIEFRPTLPDRRSIERCPRLLAFARSYGARPSAQRTPYQIDSRSHPREKRTMKLEQPALDPSTLTPRTSSAYPEVFRSRVTPREKRALGDALGLTQFGVNLTTLSPGKESALRHRHAREDELVFVLEGEVVLRTEGREQVLTAGMCAGFAAGSMDAHQLVNRSAHPARYLEIGSRDSMDAVVYPDDDLAAHKNQEGVWIFTRRDGSPY